MGEKRSRRERFFKEHPYCCFCGGATPATTEDHQPGRIFFRNREWPEGFVFPACQPCNSISRQSEKLLALLIHGDGDSDDRGRFQANLASINSKYPDLVSDMIPKSTREVREILRQMGVPKPEGTIYSELPIVKLDADFWTPHFDMLARKLMLSFHYQCFKVPLPNHGATWHFIHTNADYMAGRVPKRVLELAKRLTIPERQKRLLGDQFSIRWNVIPEKRTGLFLAQFHGRLAVGGVTTENPERFKKTWGHSRYGPFTHT